LPTRLLPSLLRIHQLCTTARGEVRRHTIIPLVIAATKRDDVLLAWWTPTLLLHGTTAALLHHLLGLLLPSVLHGHCLYLRLRGGHTHSWLLHRLLLRGARRQHAEALFCCNLCCLIAHRHAGNVF